jgi:hypothetical protein
MTPADQVDARIHELVSTFPAEPRRHVQHVDGDWLPCWRDYRRIPKGDERLVYLPVSETAGEWTVVALCAECARAEW